MRISDLICLYTLHNISHTNVWYLIMNSDCIFFLSKIYFYSKMLMGGGEVDYYRPTTFWAGNGRMSGRGITSRKHGITPNKNELSTLNLGYIPLEKSSWEYKLRIPLTKSTYWEWLLKNWPSVTLQGGQGNILHLSYCPINGTLPIEYRGTLTHPIAPLLNRTNTSLIGVTKMRDIERNQARQTRA